MTQKKKIIGLLYRQCYLLKKFKDTRSFWETLGISKSTIYFKMNLYSLMKKYRRLHNSALSSNYLKNNLKKIKSKKSKKKCEQVQVNFILASKFYLTKGILSHQRNLINQGNFVSPKEFYFTERIFSH